MTADTISSFSIPRAGRAKYARLTADLDQGRMTLRALSAECRYAADGHTRLFADVVANLRNTSPNWRPADGVEALLRLGAEELRHMGASSLLPQAREAAAELARMGEMQGRIDALQATLAPLSVLVGRLQTYVEAHGHE